MRHDIRGGTNCQWLDLRLSGSNEWLYLLAVISYEKSLTGFDFLVNS